MRTLLPPLCKFQLFSATSTSNVTVDPITENEMEAASCEAKYFSCNPLNFDGNKYFFQSIQNEISAVHCSEEASFETSENMDEKKPF